MTRYFDIKYKSSLNIPISKLLFVDPVSILAARDYHGYDSQRECEAGARQVQDFEGSEERKHQEES